MRKLIFYFIVISILMYACKDESKKDSIDDLSIKIKQWFENNKDLNRETIRNNCYSIIDEKYNPHYQSALIEKLVLNDLQSPK